MSLPGWRGSLSVPKAEHGPLQHLNSALKARRVAQAPAEYYFALEQKIEEIAHVIFIVQKLLYLLEISSHNGHTLKYFLPLLSSLLYTFTEISHDLC